MTLRRVLTILIVAAAAATTAILIWTSVDHTLFRVAVTSVVAIVALAVVIDPELFRRLPVESLKLPLGFEIGFRGLVEQGEAKDREADADDLNERWLEVHWKLEFKLAYLAKYTLPDHLPWLDRSSDGQGEARPYANIGSLQHDKLLENEDAKIATMALALSPMDLEITDSAELKRLLDAAEGLAHVLRARVFQGLVKRYIAERGWVTEEIEGLQWRVGVEGGHRVVIVPVFGQLDGDLVTTQLSRLGNEPSIFPSLVVVPHWPGDTTVPALPESGQGDPVAVRFDQIKSAVSKLTAPNSDETPAGAKPSTNTTTVREPSTTVGTE